nr:hypothetical protein [Propionibacterium sp.]
MTRRILIDVGLGLLLAVVGQFAQLAASIIGPALGLPHPYDYAPADGSVPPALLDQINTMFLIAAPLMVLVTFGLGWLRKLRGPAEGLTSGAIWAAVVGLSQFLLGLGQGVVDVMGLVGTWVYLAALVLGPVLAGLAGARRPAR